MALVAIVEHVYPGAFRGGEIGWRYFWALVKKLPMVRAIDRREGMLAELYATLLQTKKGATHAVAMMRETEAEATTLRPRDTKPDPWEAMTASGRRRLQRTRDG